MVFMSGGKERGEKEREKREGSKKNLLEVKYIELREEGGLLSLLSFLFVFFPLFSWIFLFLFLFLFPFLLSPLLSLPPSLEKDNNQAEEEKKDRKIQ